MNGDNNNDWRFKDFKDTGGAYNRTLAVDTPFSRAQFAANPSPTSPLTGPTGSGGVTAASRVIPSPSGTNWEKTFGANGGFNSPAPSSPSGTDWRKTFGAPTISQGYDKPSTPAPNLFSGSNRQSNPSDFSFNLSAGNDQSQLSLGTDSTSFYKDRTANMDLTTRDHELYGAGKDYGFAY